MPVRYQNSPLSLGRRDPPKSIDLGSPTPRNFLPISPPETDRVVPGLVADPRQHQPQTSLSFPDGLRITPPTATGEPPSRYRRSPSIPYMQSGLQSRAHPAPSRPSRWLVVVMPPSSLNSEPALGHTLSTGPPGRFQSGILMPLFPTLYGQLAAISKEFSLPSTTGVCVYLHVSDFDLNLAPRISDEAWQLLWSHYFIPDEGAPSYPSHQLPICGQIEFDIDIRKARWYESWISGHARHHSLEATIPPAIAQSLSKWYSDAARDRDDDPELHDDASVRGKQIPRPLALGRREGSVRSMHKYKAINPFDGDAESTLSRAVSHRLPPVAQANEPAAVKQHDLNTLVRNWRASTPAVPALPREEGTAKDTLESPGFELDLDDFQWSISSTGPAWYPENDESAYARSVNLEARLEGSVALTPSVATSFGPDDVTTPTYSNVSRYPSPDIAARFRESAPISPVTATSWGAPLSWPTTPMSIERVRSPDLAARVVFSRPQTPVTATSWGAPEHWPTTPFESFRPHTPDMGFREQHSRPATPSTATSWGAPEYWPPSPIERTRPHTPDYAQRVHDEDHPASFNHARPWAHVWPFSEIRKEQQRALLESKQGSFRFVWPFMGKLLQPTMGPTSKGAHDENHPALFNYANAWPHVWPLSEIRKEQEPALLESKHGSFRFVWPFLGKDLRPIMDPTSKGAHDEDHSTSYNHATPWVHVWPFSEIRKEQERALLESKHGSFRFVWPFSEIRKEQERALLESKHGSFQFVWPFMGKDLQLTMGTTSKGAHDENHPALFKHANAWPHVWPLSETRKQQGRALLESRHGSFRFVWPFLVMDPTSKGAHDEDYSALYSHAKPWVHVWPFSEIRKEQERALLESKHGSFRFVWPFMGKELQPTMGATSRGAHDENRPALSDHANAWPHVWPLSETRKEQARALLESRYGGFRFVWPFMGDGAQRLAIDWTSSRSPNTGMSATAMELETNNKLDPLAFVWPFFQTARPHPSPRSVVVPSTYPFLQIYLPVYPHVNEVYASKSGDALEVPKCQNVRLHNARTYDYPKLVIYPSKDGEGDGEEHWRARAIDVNVKVAYPDFNFYLAVYPFVCPYPVPDELNNLKIRPVLLGDEAPEYPAFDIYNTGVVTRPAPAPQSVRLQAAYPALALYEDVYPSLTVYPPIIETVTLKVQPVLLPESVYNYPVIGIYGPTSTQVIAEHKGVTQTGSYGRLNLYPAAYPYIEPYPPCDAVELKTQEVLLPSSEYHYPVIGIYGPTSAQVIAEHKGVTQTGFYGRLNLYPAAYPYIEPYPPCDAVELKTQEVLLPSSEYHYPVIGIYGPAFQMAASEPCSVPLPSYYGRLNLYPAFYPSFEVYPAADPVEVKKQSVLLSSQECEYPDLLIYPGCKPGAPVRPQELPVVLPSSYGRLSLYPATYPPEPYPPMDPVELKMQSVLKAEYEYPAIVIYPGCACASSTNGPVVLPTRLPAVYPSFDLYAAVYPFVEPYPNAHFEKIVPITPEFTYPDILIYAPVHELIRPTYIDVKLPLTQGYPSFDLYEPGYPVICPYPAVHGPTKAMILEDLKLRSVRVTVGRRVAYPSIEPYTPLADRPTPQSVRLSVAYPAFDLYPALDSIYPPIELAAQCMKLSPLQHDGFMYPTIIIYRQLAVNPLEPCKVIEPPSKQGQGVSVKKSRKTHVQLYNEVFRNVVGYNSPHVDPNVISILSHNLHRVKQRKTHQELWREACPNGPKPDVPSALASPVSELPTFNQAPRLGRSRSASIARTQPSIGISRIPSLRSSQPLPTNPAPPAALPGRMRAMSRATVRPTVDAEPSTRTNQISLSLLSRSAEDHASDKENPFVSTRPSQVRRQFEPHHPRSGSIVQRTAHMFETHPGEKHGSESASNGTRLSRTPSKLDRSKFPFA